MPSGKRHLCPFLCDLPVGIVPVYKKDQAVKLHIALDQESKARSHSITVLINVWLIVDDTFK